MGGPRGNKTIGKQDRGPDPRLAAGTGWSKLSPTPFDLREIEGCAANPRRGSHTAPVDSELRNKKDLNNRAMDTTCRGLLRRDGPPTGRCGTPNTPAGISHCQRRRTGAAGEVGAPMGERRGGLRIHWRAGLVTLKKVVTQSNECLGHPTDCVPEPKQGEQARVVGTETAARGSGGAAARTRVGLWITSFGHAGGPQFPIPNRTWMGEAWHS